jgi:hypothetical protein
MKEFKFLRKNDHYVLSLPLIRRMAGRTVYNELFDVVPAVPRTRECAVIASSIQDFNYWRNGTFDRSHAFIVTNRDFLHTNGVSGIPTRYRAITRIDDCYGLTFDDYITTDRIEDILLSGYEDTIDYIRQLIVEVNLHTRDEDI